jgi:hypothetical protein
MSRSLPEKALGGLDVAERRREPREEASGTAVLFVEGASTWSIEGTLLDVSDSGFRLEHSHGGLTTGTEVRFTYPGRQGRAKVCWNRIANGRVESGFFVIARRQR